jgi:hypothetical protein
MEWTTPAAEAGVLTTQRDVSIWPGIGTGQSANDVLAQAGTQSTAGPAGVQSTYAWTELYPVQPTEVQITNLPVGAGDMMGVTISAGYLSQTATTATTGDFGVCNMTHGTCVTILFTVPSGGKIIGRNAEWIAERPGIGSGFSELDNFGSVQFTYVSAATAEASANYIWLTNANRPGETTYRDTMKSCNGSTTLADPGAQLGANGAFTDFWVAHGQLESC